MRKFQIHKEMVKATVSNNISISKYAEENREYHQINGSNISSIIELVSEQYLGPHTPKLQWFTFGGRRETTCTWQI